MADVFGLNADDLPEHWTPLEFVGVIKCLDEDGDTALSLRTSDGLRVWDSVGLLTVALDTQRAEAQAGFISDTDDDEPEDDD